MMAACSSASLLGWASRMSRPCTTTLCKSVLPLPIHCIEDRLCVWRPYSLMELSYQVVLIEGQPTWSGRAKHSYGHLLFLDMANGVHDVQLLQIAHPEVIPHGIRCEGLLRVLSWVSFDLPTHLKGMVGELLQAASVTSLSPVARFINSGGTAIAATLVLPGNAEYSVSISCRASPVNEPAENPYM